MASLRASTTKSEGLPDDPTASVPTRRWKLPSITTWDDSRNQNHPTDSAEEVQFPSSPLPALTGNMCECGEAQGRAFCQESIDAAFTSFEARTCEAMVPAGRAVKTLTEKYAARCDPR